MPLDTRSSPQAVTPKGRHFRTDSPAAQQAESAQMITGGLGSTQRQLPLAFASQAAPCAGRTLWAVMYSCGACGGHHFGRSREELTTGKRTARCGRVVWLVIARTYRGTP